MTAWMADALCKGATSVWFPHSANGSGRPKHDQTLSAYNGQYDVPRSVCSRCPVAAECKAAAFGGDERWGMWGGLTPRERHKIARSSRSKQCKQCRTMFLPRTSQVIYCSPDCLKASRRVQDAARRTGTPGDWT